MITASPKIKTVFQRGKEGFSSIASVKEKINPPDIKKTAITLAPAFLGLSKTASQTLTYLSPGVAGGTIGYFVEKKTNFNLDSFAAPAFVLLTMIALTVPVIFNNPDLLGPSIVGAWGTIIGACIAATEKDVKKEMANKK